MSTNELVLVTGGTRADEVRRVLRVGGVSEEQANGVSFCAADLEKDEGWPEACQDCTYVLHVASPFPLSAPKHEDDLIIPAREGTLRALRAAKTAGTVKRVVVTSSFAAIGYGHAPQSAPFNEDDWTDLNGIVPPYQKSKTIAEGAAWDWIAKEGGDMQMAVVNPVGIFGPLLSKDYAASCEIVVRLMNGAIPGLPHFAMNPVDARDVADLHIRAMTDPKAAGQRYIATAPGDALWLHEYAALLKKRLGDKARKVPTRQLPDWLLKVVAMFDASVGLVVPELGKKKNATSQKAVEQLGWQPRSGEDSIVATAESMPQFGLQK
ncbi:hypothetical protein LTR57_025267 [Friedmanniomyces endolithicus]|nr:hypothetical protein LTR94_021564 [Friedmanniomyces endolithicus]KAK0768983.1 hypothetical protein LTR59_017299 [Friedmanniomyces endolithicus]KAK0772001.1 hypothetical protein LTR38_017030 [Friedmanniomyces endolithicus]KAK0889879.1 hypothetical protein LTR57_025267 [Friedmanniomyces endolithicus]